MIVVTFFRDRLADGRLAPDAHLGLTSTVDVYEIGRTPEGHQKRRRVAKFFGPYLEDRLWFAVKLLTATNLPVVYEVVEKERSANDSRFVRVTTSDYCRGVVDHTMCVVTSAVGQQTGE